jgi:hypothetical protein
MAEYVSLATVQQPDFLETREESGKAVLGWSMSLPQEVDIEKIEVNMSRIALLHRIGAFSASIVNSYDGPVTEQNQAWKTGYANSGAADTNRTTLSVPESDLSLFDRQLVADHLAGLWYGKPVINHLLNRNEAAVNTETPNGRKPQTPEQAWARGLDAAMRTSFRTAGRAHLKDRISLSTKLVTYGFAEFAAFDAYQLIDRGHAPVILSIYAGSWALGLMTDSTILKKATGSNQFGQRRWSVMLGNQIDRYLVLTGACTLPGLVRHV